MQSYQRFHASVIRTSRVSQTPSQTPPPYFYQWVSHGKNGLGAIVYKWPTFTFVHESGYTLGFQRKIAHSGSHAETGAIQMGALLLPSDCFTRFRNPAWPGVERQTVPLLGLGRGHSRRTQRACGTAMRLCASLSRRRRGPAGLRDPFSSVEIVACMPCAQGLSACARHGRYHYPRRALRVAETPDGRLSKRLVCRFLAPPM